MGSWLSLLLSSLVSLAAQWPVPAQVARNESVMAVWCSVERDRPSTKTVRIGQSVTQPCLGAILAQRDARSRGVSRHRPMRMILLAARPDPEGRWSDPERPMSGCDGVATKVCITSRCGTNLRTKPGSSEVPP